MRISTLLFNHSADRQKDISVQIRTLFVYGNQYVETVESLYLKTGKFWPPLESWNHRQYPVVSEQPTVAGTELKDEITIVKRDLSKAKEYLTGNRMNILVAVIVVRSP